MIVLYVVAAIAANLMAYAFGPAVTPYTALALIGFNFTARDSLHEQWRGGLRLKMGSLIMFASVATWLLNPAGGRVALASAVAFLVSETVDTIVYQSGIRWPWLVKTTASNVAGAAFDSVIFPTLAFGVFLPWIVVGQFAAKVFGGYLWALALRHRKTVTVAAVALLSVAVSADAQVAAINGAWIKNDFINAAAGEVFVAAPAVKGIRAYSIISWNTGAGTEPTVLARLGYSLYPGDFQLGIGGGVIHVPGDPHLRPSFSAIAFYGGRRRLRPYVLVAYEEPFGAWDVTTFVGLSYTLKFWR